MSCFRRFWFVASAKSFQYHWNVGSTSETQSSGIYSFWRFYNSVPLRLHTRSIVSSFIRKRKKTKIMCTQIYRRIVWLCFWLIILSFSHNAVRPVHLWFASLWTSSEYFVRIGAFDGGIDVCVCVSQYQQIGHSSTILSAWFRCVCVHFVSPFF